jgi:hypothetical protein
MITADDIAEIRDVAALYGHAVDDRDWDALARVYVPDGVYDGTATGSTRYEGFDAIVGYLSRTIQPFVHHATNLCLDEPDDAGTRVTGREKWFVVRRDLSVASGEYRDTWVKTADGWRLQERASFRLTPVPPPPEAVTPA